MFGASVSRCPTPPRHFRGAVCCRDTRALDPAGRSVGGIVASPRVGARRPSGCELCQTIDVTGEQRHIAESDTATRDASHAAAKRYRHRRLAWRRNYRYGTIICDLERQRPIRVLPDREPATAEAWLTGQPQTSVIARDRGEAYARAPAKALPLAMQVADRRHLMENASQAFLDAVRRSMRQIRRSVGAMTITPKLLTAAERLQCEGYLHREETNASAMAIAKGGEPPSRRSFVAPVTARAWTAGSCAASGATSSGFGRVRWGATSRDWTSNWPWNAETAPNFGGA